MRYSNAIFLHSLTDDTIFIRQCYDWIFIVCLPRSLFFLFWCVIGWCSLLSSERWGSINVLFHFLCSFPPLKILLFLRRWKFWLLGLKSFMIINVASIMEETNFSWRISSKSSQIRLVIVIDQFLWLFLNDFFFWWEVIFLFGSLAFDGSTAVCYLYCKYNG